MKDDQPYQDDWQAEAPLLSKIPKRRPDGPPPGYFGDFPDHMMARIQALEAENRGESVPVRSLNPQQPSAPAKGNMRIWAVAASVSLLLVAAYLLWPRPHTESVISDAEFAAQLAALDNASIVDALDQSDVHPDELLALLGTDTPLDLEAVGPGQSKAMIDYLEDEDLDDLDLENLDIDPIELL